MDWGGSPDIFRIICERLDPAVFDLRIIVGLTRHPTQKTTAFFAEFKDRIIFMPRLVRDPHVADDFATFRRLYAVFRKEKFDIVHTHTAKAGALARLAAFCAGVRVIIHTPHGHNFYGYYNRFISGIIVLIEKFLTSLTAKVIVLTELERADYISYGVSDSARTIALPTAVEFEELSPAIKSRDQVRTLLGIGLDQTVIGFVGRLEPIKGPAYLLEAAHGILARYGNVVFVFMGEGSLRRELADKASARGLADRVMFVGWQENAAVLMSAFDILVLPSLNEAVGLVLIEAQAQAVPVVATKVGGIPEVVKDGETGILVPAADAAALQQVIEELLNDPPRRRAMAQNAQDFVKNRFGAGRLAQNISRVYLEMRNRPGRQ